MLPSASITVAMRVPPPTSCGSPASVAPAARRLRLGERGVDVVDTDVRHRCGQALLMTMGVEPDLDAPHVEPDVEGLVGVGLGAEKGGVDGLGSVDVADGVDDGLEVVHALVTCAGRRM